MTDQTNTPKPEESKPNLTEVLVKKQVSNIMKKMNAGKILTAREENLISQYQSENSAHKRTYIIGKAKLARALSISRPTLDSWCKTADFPKCSINGSYCYEDVMEWVKIKGVKGSETSEAEKLRLRRLLSQCQKTENENDILMGKYRKKSDVESEIIRMVTAFNIVLSELPKKAAMTLSGRSAAEIERVLNDMVQDIRLQLHRDPWRA